jgi:hypothetical protein
VGAEFRTRGWRLPPELEDPVGTNSRANGLGWKFGLSLRWEEVRDSGREGSRDVEEVVDILGTYEEEEEIIWGGG